jgi:hypothetical protein
MSVSLGVKAYSLHGIPDPVFGVDTHPFSNGKWSNGRFAGRHKLLASGPDGPRRGIRLIQDQRPDAYDFALLDMDPYRAAHRTIGQYFFWHGFVSF